VKILSYLHRHGFPGLVGLCCMVLICSCAYQDRVQPIPLASANPGAVHINGVSISATVYANRKAAKEAFGFDIRKAGLMPVQVVFQNEGKSTVEVIPDQTFLIDSKNQAWPISSRERTYQRINRFVDVGNVAAGARKPALLLGAAGAVAGLAIGIVTGENIGESVGKGAALGAAAGAIGGGAHAYANAKDEIRQDLWSKSLTTRRIQPNQIAYGMLFFPGFPYEAQDAKLLKLSLSFDGKTQIVNLIPSPPAG
jgi:hypothetical protein